MATSESDSAAPVDGPGDKTEDVGELSIGRQRFGGARPCLGEQRHRWDDIVAGLRHAVCVSIDVLGAAGDPVVEGPLVGADDVGGHLFEGGHDPAMGAGPGLIIGLGEVLDPLLIA